MVKNIKKKFYKAKNDQVFKSVFCKEGNQDLLEAFIEDALKRKVKILKLFPPELTKNNIYVKGKTLDVLIEVDKEIINLELNSSYYNHLNRRNASYIFSKYTEDPKVGKNYSEMKNYIQMNFTSGLPKDKPIKSEYVLADIETKDKFVDNLTIYEYNIDKIKDLYKKGKSEYKFIAALDCDKSELDQLCKGNKIMEKFKDEVNDINEDITFTQYMTDEEDTEILINTLMSEAKEEGMKIGNDHTRFEIAKNMLDNNIDVDTIAECTGLTKEEIEGLK